MRYNHATNYLCGLLRRHTRTGSIHILSYNVELPKTTGIPLAYDELVYPSVDPIEWFLVGIDPIIL